MRHWRLLTTAKTREAANANSPSSTPMSPTSTLTSKRKGPTAEGSDGDAPVSKRARRSCNVAECTNQQLKGGVCAMHVVKVNTTCSQPGCNNQAQKGGVCLRHGAKIKTFKHEGCTSYVQNSGVCIKHGAKRNRCKHEGCTSYAQNGGVCKRDELAARKDVATKARRGEFVLGMVRR